MMLTISKPLSAAQAQAYHKEEFANAQENYYSEGDRICGEWHGRLAQQWGLRGEVNEEHFPRLANGQHPVTEVEQEPTAPRIEPTSPREVRPSEEEQGHNLGMGLA
jgi:hypothetical protein